MSLRKLELRSVSLIWGNNADSVLNDVSQSQESDHVFEISVTEVKLADGHSPFHRRNTDSSRGVEESDVSDSDGEDH